MCPIEIQTMITKEDFTDEETDYPDFETCSTYSFSHLESIDHEIESSEYSDEESIVSENDCSWLRSLDEEQLWEFTDALEFWLQGMCIDPEHTIESHDKEGETYKDGILHLDIDSCYEDFMEYRSREWYAEKINRGCFLKGLELHAAGCTYEEGSRFIDFNVMIVCKYYGLWSELDRAHHYDKNPHLIKF